MKTTMKTILYIILLTIMLCSSGCGFLNQEDSKDKEIKKNFQKTLNLYPTKNLEDFYDKEGYRDEEFDKDDKGTWVIHSEMNVENNGEDMISRGMVLRINRNSKTTRGDYILTKTWEDKKGRAQHKGMKYPVKMKHNQIIPTKPIKDDKIKKEIENFKFFVQYGNFKNIKDYKDGDISYNPNVPSYSAEYQLSNDDNNVKQLRKRYDIPTDKAPKLLLKGTGDLKGSSVGSKDIEFTFIENQEENIYFTDSVEFNPSTSKSE
ncbi:tandem-type lipoprotein [Staphylococcus warneri]|uniref:tandem-type lipoprotein n=1 Tax=Staphylococcus warneri TaxID=1292 RepID=UPI000D1DA5AC|nr:tandem-type lipoprotein [Staphylococcus warneri]PTI16535.1 tandem-type lipoprotein [Staphylococcus warneri]